MTIENVLASASCTSTAVSTRMRRCCASEALLELWLWLSPPPPSSRSLHVAFQSSVSRSDPRRTRDRTLAAVWEVDEDLLSLSPPRRTISAADDT